MRGPIGMLQLLFVYQYHAQVVQAYNNDPKVHGILVQLPLPPHINERRILDAISLEKDVDGFSPANIGSLGMRGIDPMFVPCTPLVREAD